MAFQIQKLYERDARGGTRYIEVLKSHFGVTSPDARLQRPEYLGGSRIPININQVIQNSATIDGSTPLGDTAAYSVTTDSHGDFIKSFVVHGVFNSNHLRGLAADIPYNSTDYLVLSANRAKWHINELIHEHRGTSEWIHVSVLP